MNPLATFRSLNRFLSRVRIGSTCWEWQGKRTNNGYGYVSTPSGTTTAHRYSYKLFVSEVADDLAIDHLCRNRLCVNPLHLEAVTPKENNRRYGAIKTHCSHGHGVKLEYIHGTRRCPICTKATTLAANRRYDIKRNAQRRLETKRRQEQARIGGSEA